MLESLFLLASLAYAKADTGYVPPSFQAEAGHAPGMPVLHTHAVVSFPDGSAKAGHLLTPLPKTRDPETGLELINP